MLSRFGVEVVERELPYGVIEQRAYSQDGKLQEVRRVQPPGVIFPHGVSGKKKHVEEV